MNCDSYIELMSAALDGQCSPDEMRRLEEHVAQCPSCAQLYRQLATNARAARELDCEMPEDLRQRILSSLPAQDAPTKKKTSRLLKIWAPVAAAACLVLVIVGTASTGVFDVANGMAGSSDAPGSLDNATGRDPSPTFSYGSTVGNTEVSDGNGGVPEAGVYALVDPQVIRVCYGATPEASAVVIGSVDSLADYLEQFQSLIWDGDGNVVPIEALEALSERYTGDFFSTHRLLCVVVESGSGSNRYELSSLTRDAVTVLEHIPEVGTCDMAAWLLVAEVDGNFSDGDILEVLIDTDYAN